VLARQEFGLGFYRVPVEERYLEPELNEYREFLLTVEYVGKPIGFAVKDALKRLKPATGDELVAFMQHKGFRFKPDSVPARELHGALNKQSWAKRDAKTQKWTFVGPK